MTTGGTSQTELQAILYQALAEPVGLLLRATDPERARQRLYKARSELGDPALARLQIRISPLDEGELVLVKGEDKA
jgi:hypothetical protein